MKRRPEVCSSRAEYSAERGRDIPMRSYKTRPASPDRGQLPPQFHVILTAGIDENVKPRQARGEKSRGGARICNAIRDQNPPRIPNRNPGKLPRSQFERKRDIGEPSSRQSQNRIE